MENEHKSAVQSFLEGTEDNKFEQVIDNPFIESEQGEVVEEQEEKPLPFHKDPKVQKFIDKELERRLKDFKPEPQAESKETDEFKDVMDAMTAAIGNDTPEKQNALKAYKDALTRLDQRSATAAQQYLEDIKHQELSEEREAEEELDNAFESIEENFGVDLISARSQKVRSDFLTFVERIAPKDRNGEIIDYPDMNSAWETFSEIRKSSTPPSRAKQLASNGLSRSSETSSSAQGKRPTFDMDIEDMIGGTK